MSVTTVNRKENSPAAYGKEDFLRDDFQPAAMQKIVQEGILLAGGALVILLQVANPGVGAGVNEHSNFAYRVQDRLRTTLTYVYCMGFGTPDEKRAIVEMIHRAHAPVSGTLANGTTYRADDPGLQLWVAATLYATGMDVYQRVFGTVPEPEADQMYREYSIVASSLRVPPEMWPQTRADFWEYWDGMIATLEVTDHARAVARDLLALKHAPFKLRMLMPFVRMSTVEWMPERIRQGYGLKVSRGKHAIYKINEVLLKALYPALPLKLRSYPARHYLADMRHRLAKMGSVVDKEAKDVPH